MKRLGEAAKRGKGYLALLIGLLTLCLVLPRPRPALANGPLNVSGTETNEAIMYSILGVLGLTAVGYGLWENQPSRQGQPRYLNGEFYAGGYLGAALTPNQDLKFTSGAGWCHTPAFTAQTNKFDPAVVGGLKIGYFFNSVKFLGLEVENSVNRTPVRSQNVTLSTPVAGSNRAILPDDPWLNYTMALHLVARYGFFPDQEVPFGRLQPYVGFGPGFVFIFDRMHTSADFAPDVMAGIRFMMLKNVSAFVEYKYSHVWGADLEHHVIAFPNLPTELKGSASFDYDSHKIVAGVAYHF